MKRPVHRNKQSNVVNLSDARTERAAQLAVSAADNIGVRQQALLSATLRKFESAEQAPVAAAQVFVRSDGSIETTINNVEPEHIGSILSALRRIHDVLTGVPRQARARRSPRERGVADTYFALSAVQILGFATAVYINTNPWIDVALTVGGEAIAIAACRLMTQAQ